MKDGYEGREFRGRKGLGISIEVVSWYRGIGVGRVEICEVKR